MQRRRFRPLLVLASVLGAAVLIVLVAGWAVLYTKPFESLRRSEVASLLDDELGLITSVNGDVELSYGLNPTLTIENVSCTDPDKDSALKVLSAEKLVFTVSLNSLFTGKVKPTALTAYGLKVDLDYPEKKSQAAADEAEQSDIANFVQGLVRTTFTDDLTVNGLTVSYVDQEVGLDALYVFKRVSSLGEDGSKVIRVTGEGTVNDQPMAVNGTVEPSTSEAGGNSFSFTIDHPGLTAKLIGTYEIGESVDTIEADADGQSASLSAFLDVYRVQHGFDGRGEATGKLSGTLSAMRLADLKLGLVFEKGDTFDLSGSVQDVMAGTGINVVMNSTLAPSQAPQADQKPLVDLSITGFSGRIAGAVDGLLLRDLHVVTNSVRAQIHEIGPISAERVWKDPQGHVGLYQLTILAGDPDRPSVRVQGSIKDILEMKGVDLNGSVDFEIASTLGLAAEDNSAALGRLQGTVSVSDADGSIGIESLSASSADTTLLDLKLDLVFDDIKKTDELKFDTKLSIPDFTAFSAAIGSQVEELGAVTFTGQVSGSDERLNVTGITVIGKTTLTVKLTGEGSETGPLLSGDLSTPFLDLVDLKKLASIRTVYLQNDDGTDDIDTSKIEKTLKLDMQVQADKIDGGGKTASNVEGRITYLDGKIGLDPLKVTFLGGKASTNGEIDIGGDVKAFALTGRIDDMGIASILKELEVSYPISGTLHMSYDLKGKGGSAAEIPASLNGNMTASLHSGHIGTSLLDLAGLNLPTWLLKRSGKGAEAELVCLIAPYNFTNGNGTTRTLVLETRDVQVRGAGYVDFRSKKIDMKFAPRPLHTQFIDIPKPFRIEGPLSKPHLHLSGAPVAGIAAEVLAFPLNLVGTLFDVGPDAPNRVPCRTAAR